MKTPVSVLQELLARRGTVPKYELVQIEGMIHEPTFRYRVTVADLVGKNFGSVFELQFISNSLMLLNDIIICLCYFIVRVITIPLQGKDLPSSTFCDLIMIMSIL